LFANLYQLAVYWGGWASLAIGIFSRRRYADGVLEMRVKQYFLASALCILPFAASAADLPVKAPIYKAPVAAIYNWTGFYVGGNVGYGWGQGDVTYSDPTFGLLPASISGSNINGAIGGLQAGYNWQFDNRWVAGFEADFQWSGQKASTNFFSSDTEGGNISGSLSAKLLWFGTLRGRFGVLATPTPLIYATGGLAYGRVEASGSVTDPILGSVVFNSSSTKTGWTIGGGVEGAIPNTRAWTWKVEYLYMDLGSINGSGLDSSGGTYNWTAKFTDNIVRVGANYRFP
jgi:outer membrane immunogenic protein